MGLDIVSLLVEDKAAYSMEICYTSSMDLTSPSFREIFTGLRRRFIDVRAAPAEYFYQRQDQFSINQSFFSFPDQ